MAFIVQHKFCIQRKLHVFQCTFVRVASSNNIDTYALLCTRIHSKHVVYRGMDFEKRQNNTSSNAVCFGMCMGCALCDAYLCACVWCLVVGYGYCGAAATCFRLYDMTICQWTGIIENGSFWIGDFPVEFSTMGWWLKDEKKITKKIVPSFWSGLVKRKQQVMDNAE